MSQKTQLSVLPAVVSMYALRHPAHNLSRLIEPPPSAAAPMSPSAPCRWSCAPSLRFGARSPVLGDVVTQPAEKIVDGHTPPDVAVPPVHPNPPPGPTL